MPARATPSESKSTSAGQATPALPVQLTPFIGREPELESAFVLLESSRLLTLTGAGGIGKTRLAIELATRAAGRLAAELRWVDLAPLSDPTLLVQHVAAMLGAPEEAGRSHVDVLTGAVCRRSVLLVLDSCEHVVEACAQLADALLRGCPGVRILATSRERLGIAGETAWLVPPLSLPGRHTPATAASLATSEAAQLFVQRARSVLPGFELTDLNAPAIARICRRLDGVPLAIELAAARVRVLGPEQIAERLDDSFRLLTSGARMADPRHRTLRSAIDWSFALLDPIEQVLLRRLAVFWSSFSLEAVETVCADAILGRDEILDALATLVDRSLVLRHPAEEEARYRLLETVRQYGYERLEQAGEIEELRRRHAGFYITYAELAEPHIFGGASDGRWLLQLDRDHGNLRAAAAWCLEGNGETGDHAASSDVDAAATSRQAADLEQRTELGLRLGFALHWLSFASGRFAEGRRFLEDMLARPARVQPPVRARALTALGFITCWQGEFATLRPLFEEAVASLRQADDEFALAHALCGLGMAHVVTGDAGGAGPHLDEAVETARRAGPSVLLALTLYWHALAARDRGEHTRAEDSLREATSLGRALGNMPATAHPLAVLGQLLVARGESEAAATCLAEALTMHLAASDSYGVLQALHGITLLAARDGDALRTATLLGASTARAAKVGLSLPPVEAQEATALAATARSSLGEPAFNAATANGRALTHAALETYAIDGIAPRAAGIPTIDSLASLGNARDAVALEDTSSQTLAAPVPTLRVLALGPVEVYRHGVLVSGDVWASTKPRELLLFLLCHPEGCSKGQVGLALWPESSADRVRNSFHVTLHRLRKALGDPTLVVLQGEMYRITADDEVHFDAAIFEAEASAALRALRSDAAASQLRSFGAATQMRAEGAAGQRRTGGAAAAHRLEVALALYRGDFLEHESVGDWHLAVRDRLRRLHLDALAALGEWRFESGDGERAAELFRRIITLDDVNEEAYRRLMVLHARAGDRAQALRLFDRLASTLLDGFDAKPSEQTIRLHGRIQRAEEV